MDDVLCETAATLCGLARNCYGVRIDYEDIRDFNLQRSFGFSDEEIHRFMADAHSPERILSYPETFGAADGLRALVAAGHSVEIVTGRAATTFRATEEWLHKVGLGGFPVTYVNKYGRLFSKDGNAPEMLPVAELLVRKYDFAIDDSPMILPELAKWNHAEILVFDRPWNRKYPLAPNMQRVINWPEIVKRICE